jgi:hypothetical protein
MVAASCSPCRQQRASGARFRLIHNLKYILDLVNRNLKKYLDIFVKSILRKSKISCIFTDMIVMEGLTAEEMGKILKIEENTVLQRLYVAGIKPLTKKAVYDKSALEAIRNVPGKGRPKKPKPEAPDRAENKD